MKNITLLIAAFMFLSVSAACFAQSNAVKEKRQEPSITSEVKEVEGELVWVGRNYISISYERNDQTGEEKEIRLDFDPQNVTLQHIRNIKQLNTGDRVYVRYVDETKDFGTTKENTIKAQVVRYVRPVASDSPYKKKEDKESVPEESLSLKGVKSDE